MCHVSALPQSSHRKRSPVSFKTFSTPIFHLHRLLPPVTLVTMANFGFSIGDIILVGNYAYSVYKSCKHAGEDFRSIAADGKKDFP